MNMKMPVVACIALGLALPVAALHATEPAPAFAGQTDAPPPATPSLQPKISVVATGMTGAWSVAFLPGGNLLVSHSEGLLRVVRPDGFVSAPLTGLPDVKQVSAQGFHDLLLDPDFARNRRFYFTFTAPPLGEAPGRWPLAHWYENVWTLPVAERLKLNLGMEKVASARLSEDLRSITDVKILAEGAERRVVLAPDGNLLVTGADRFRFYDSDLDGADHDFSATPDVRRNYSGAVLRVGIDTEGQSLAVAAFCSTGAVCAWPA
jgi:glucose/arabinose dehydrogenase